MAVDLSRGIKITDPKSASKLGRGRFFFGKPAGLQNAGGIVSAKGAKFLSLEKGAESK